MKIKLILVCLSFVAVVSAFRHTEVAPAIISARSGVSATDTILFPGETHFANVQQLTFGGDNAEAYFSFDGKWLIFQKSNAKEGIACDQIWMGKVPVEPGEKFEPKLVSNGLGRTTCAYFF